MNKDEIHGAGKQVKGAIKNAAGKATGNAKLAVEGNAEKTVGKLQTEIGKAEAGVKHSLRR